MAGDGLEIVSSSLSISEAGRVDARDEPDFRTRFSLCHCGAEDCEACSGFQLSGLSGLSWAAGYRVLERAAVTTSTAG